MEEDFGELYGRLRRHISRQRGWYRRLVRKQLDGTCNPLRSCFRDINTVASVVLARTTDVPSIHTMWTPCSSHFRRFIYYYLCTRWGQWGLVIIKGAIEDSISGDEGVDAGRPKEVQCCLCVFYQPTPHVHWEGGVKAGIVITLVLVVVVGVGLINGDALG